MGMLQERCPRRAVSIIRRDPWLELMCISKEGGKAAGKASQTSCQVCCPGCCLQCPEEGEEGGEEEA